MGRSVTCPVTARLAPAASASATSASSQATSRACAPTKWKTLADDRIQHSKPLTTAWPLQVDDPSLRWGRLEVDVETEAEKRWIGLLRGSVSSGRHREHLKMGSF